MVVADSAGSTIAFTHTDGEGWFTVKPNREGAAKITVSSMGHKKKVLPIGEFLKQPTVTLEEAAVQLREVQVRPDKISQRGDTLTYNVVSFAQEQDRSIADVIKKMPGFSVAGNGQISFEGKPIGNFYIEGMDLLGDNYAQASENLNAGKVKDVQVIRNHQKVKSLRGTEFSDHAALNIVLNDDAKEAWAATAELGAGIAASHSSRQIDYDGKLMAMLFGHNMQNLSMYKCDNTGKDIAHEVDNLVASASGNSPLKGIIMAETSDIPDIESGQTRFNDSHLLATNQLFKTKRGNNLRLQADYLWDKESGDTRSETSYTDIGGIIVAEETHNHAIKNRLNGIVAYTINNDKLYLSNRLQGHINLDKAYGSTVLNGIVARQSATPHKTYATDELEITTASKKGNSISFSSANTYGYLPGQLLSVEGETERINLRILSTRHTFSLRRRHRRLTTKLTADFLAQSQSMDVDYKGQTTAESYRQLNLLLSPSVNYDGQHLKISAATSFSLAGRKLGENASTRLTIQPHLTVQYAISKSLLARLIYNYSETPISILSVYSTPLFVSYRTKASYGGKINDVGNHLLDISLAYRQPIKRNFASISLLWLRRCDDMLFQSQLDGDTYLRTPSDYRHDTGTYRLGLSASHSFYWGKTTVAADLSYMRSDYALLYQSTPTDWHTCAVNAAIKLSTQPTKHFSLELKSSLNADTQCPSKRKDMPRTNTIYYKHKLNAYFFPTKKWEICIKAAAYHSPAKALSDNLLLGSHVSYKTRHAEYRLTCSNILGNTRYSCRHIGTFANTCTTYRLRPREIVAKVVLDL